MSHFSNLLLLPAFMGATMTEEPRAIDLEVSQDGSIIEIMLKAASERTQRVSYSIEVIGQSRARHRGSTTLAANSDQVLSKLRVTADNGEWCAKVTVEEEGRAPYELVQGPCSPV